MDHPAQLPWTFEIPYEQKMLLPQTLCTSSRHVPMRFSSVAVLLGRAGHLFAVVDRLLLLVTDGVPPILTGNAVIELL